jgi:hypothetical protein
MMWLALLAAVAQAGERGPWDNYSGPYKLVITWYQSDLTVIDYPNRARCEKAKQTVEEEIAKRKAESDALAPPGSIVIGKSPNGAFCIPG